jgi:hypothetical protein
MSSVHSPAVAALVQANHPIRPGATKFYFEITVIDEGDQR